MRGALTTTANGQHATTAAGFSTPTTAGTFATIFYAATDTARQTLVHISGGDAGLVWRGDAVGDYFEGAREGTTYASYQADATNFSTYALNSWLLLVWDWTTSGGNLYLGNLSTGVLPVTPSSYRSAVTLVSPGSTTGAIRLLNHSIGTTRRAVDPVAMVACWGRVLDASERAMLQHGRVVTGAAFFHALGDDGTATVPDWSGNGWTATGSSVSLQGGPPLVNPFAWVARERQSSVASAAAPVTGRHRFFPLLGAA